MHRAPLPARCVSSWVAVEPNRAKLATPSSVTACIRARSAIGCAAAARLAKHLRRGRGDLFWRDVADLLSDVPAVSEGVGELPVKLTPELLGQRMALIGSALKRLAPKR